MASSYTLPNNILKLEEFVCILVETRSGIGMLIEKFLKLLDGLSNLIFTFMLEVNVYISILKVKNKWGT